MVEELLQWPEDITDEVMALVTPLQRHYEAQLAQREATIEARDATIAQLQAQLQLLTAKRYGASSERVSEAQLGLFNEAELNAGQDDETHEDDDLVEVTPHRRRRGQRGPLPAHLPRVTELYELPESERVCPHDGHRLEAMGEKRTEQLDIVPAKVRVREIVATTYSCPKCRQHICTAPVPPQPIPKSQASPGLLAYTTVAKYVDAIPLYRLSQQFERIEASIPRQTLARWMVRIGTELVQPLINLMREELLEGEVVHMDETTLQVLKEPGKAAQSKSWLWAQRSGARERPIVLFEYDPSRSGEVPKRLLEDFSGVLQTDKYKGYDAVVRDNGITHFLCLAHARRYFTEGLQSLGVNPNKLPPKPPDGARHYLKALSYFRSLYLVERRIRGRPPDERYAVRQRESCPVLEELHTWLKQLRPQVLPSSKLGEALGYLDRHWDGLTRFVNDGRVDIDNNRMENDLRPFCVGRRNWLFSDTPAGAKASANLYSLVMTAKANHLEPYAYLRHLFTELPKATTVEALELLLPYNVDPAALEHD